MKKIITTLLLAAFLISAGADGYSRFDSSLGSGFSFLESLQNANRQVAARILPVVVSINVTSTIRVRSPRNSSPFDAFEFFFRNQSTPEREEKDTEPSYTERQQRGSGSGIIVERQGKAYFIITNHHVAGEADRIEITLHDGRTYEASLVGSDTRRDIALLKIETDDTLPVAELGDSSTIMPGDLVYAVGNPLGFESTFTSGVVSAVNRRGGPAGTRQFTDYIQTDAPINQGNSGGALANIRGQVIGINTWIASQSGGSIGIGFAIPINNVKSAIGAFIRDGKVEYGWLGISVSDPSEENSSRLGLNGTKGSLVQNVYLGSPADKAGLLPGDYITRIDGQLINNTDELVQIVAGLQPGKTCAFDYIRQGRNSGVSVRITERDEESRILQNDANLYPGLTVESITDDIRERLSLAKNAGDVIVGHVWENSPAGKAGLRSGDIIKEINRGKIRSVKDYFSRLNDRNDSEVLFKVNRGGQDILLGIVRN